MCSKDFTKYFCEDLLQRLYHVCFTTVSRLSVQKVAVVVRKQVLNYRRGSVITTVFVLNFIYLDRLAVGIFNHIKCNNYLN